METAQKNDLTQKLVEAVEQKKYLNNSWSCMDRIYSVYDSVVAKRGTEERICYEYFWGKYALEHGVNIPYIFGKMSIDEALIKQLTPENAENHFMILRKISGEHLNDVQGTCRTDAIRQFREEVEKVIALGIYSDDILNGENSIFSRENKVYLIDYESWKIGTEKELNSLYRRIKEPSICFSGLIVKQYNVKQELQGEKQASGNF